jgi:hypothetical protein
MSSPFRVEVFGYFPKLKRFVALPLLKSRVTRLTDRGRARDLPFPNSTIPTPGTLRRIYLFLSLGP